MITDFIQKMIERVDLTEAEARQAMEEIMSGQSTDAQIAGFLTALRMKGETSQELVGFAGVMREKAEPLRDGEALPGLDTAGRVGHRWGAVDIRTAPGLVAATDRGRVAKRRNRAAARRWRRT